MAQKIKIDGKEYSCSKEVAEHIKWLEIQVSVSKEIAKQASDRLDEIKTDLYSKFQELDTLLLQIKPIF